jgi:hypothetical protein
VPTQPTGLSDVSKGRTLRFDRGFANGWNRRSAGILARRHEGLKCAVSGHSPRSPVEPLK